ncbi:MAG: hypothetical protein GX950_03790 [Candidatus Diapherotrites archaeon]|uniref:Uncharacterized protein n=1 Tax=Candidatus Iainarchaeum sp. TaxID=3101447 RepID=A0A7K4C068_9ARCH|nr:hypothetical protein [Candidatus Diapherotrites archaeon]
MNFNDEFSFGKVFQIIASTLALGLVIFLIVAALDYFGPNLQIPVIINIKEFLKLYWFIIVGYVLLISFWDYFYELYKKQLVYIKPIIDGTSLMFGLWLVVVFLKGLIVFLDPTSQTATFLTFPHDFYMAQFVIIYLLFIFVGYSKLFLRK